MASSLPASGDYSGFVEVEILYKLAALIMSLHTEIFLFTAAIAAHQLLFRTSKPNNGRPAKKLRGAKLQQAEDGRVTPSRRHSLRRNLGFLTGHPDEYEGPAAAMGAAYHRGDFKHALSQWGTLKDRSEASPAALVLAVECMLRARKDNASIIEEVAAFAQELPGDEALAAMGDLLDAMAKRPEVQLAEGILAIFPALRLHPDLRTYEILLGMYFSARRYADVETILAEMKERSITLSTKALTFAMKAALRRGHLPDARTRFRELQDAWGVAVQSSPSIAPRQLVSQLIDLACKEQQLHTLLPDLEGAPLTQDTVINMLHFCNRSKDAALAGQVEGLAQKMNIKFTDQAWCLLTKGSASHPRRVIDLMGEMMCREVEIPGDLVQYILCACNQVSDVAAADRLLQHLKPQQLPVLSSFIKFYADQEQFERACDLYEAYLRRAGEDEARDGASPGPDARLERSVMTAAVRCGRDELAKRVLQSSPANVARHVTMIRNHASAHNLAGAMEVFYSLEKTAPDLSSQVYNTVLDACVECGEVKQAEAWMKKMGQTGVLDVVSYNTMIKVHLHRGKFAEVHRLMEEMRGQGLQPNRVTYNELINALVSKGDWELRKQVWSILDEMKSCGVAPNQVTCSILLKSLQHGSPERDINRIMDFIREMEEPMDEVLLSSIVEACVRVGRPELVAKKLRELNHGTQTVVTGSHTFGSLIKAYGFAKDMKGAWRCWNEMMSRRIRPSSITLGCMVEAIVNNGDTQAAFEFIHSLQGDGQCGDALNSVIYCSVLKGFTREKDLERVWEVFEEMRERRVELSVVTYNTVIDACARCGQANRIDGLLKDMEARHIEPNVITFSTMIKAFCQAGEMQRGFEILEKMRSTIGVRPDEIVYNSLIDGCAQHGRTEEGIRVLQLMKDEGINPSNYTLSIVVKLMSRARRLDAAFEMVADIKHEYKVRPNVHVYTNLMQACISNRCLPRAMSTFEEMIMARVQPEHRTYSIIVNANMGSGNFHQAVSLLRGALGLKDAVHFLAQAKELAQCRSMDHSLVNEVLSTLVDRGFGPELAAPLLADLKEMQPAIRVDAQTQCKVMSAAAGKQIGRVTSEACPPRGSWRSSGAGHSGGSKAKGAGRGC